MAEPIEAAKRCRTAAKSKFTRLENKIQSHFEKDECVQSIDILYNDLTKVWENLEDKHNSYIALVSETEDEANNDWIDEMEQRYFNIRLSVIKHKEKTELIMSEKHTAKQLKILEERFDKSCKIVETCISKHDPLQSILREQNNVSQSFAEYRNANDKMLDLSRNEAFAKIALRKNSEMLRINELVDRHIKSVKEKEAKMKAIQIEKLPLPKFDGNIRHYPRFRKDFMDLVLPQVSAVQAPFTLRQCLPADVESYLGSCEDDVTEMMKRLDEKFGNRGRLVESIISEIKGFKRIYNDDSRALIKFVDIVEKGFIDLKKLQMESELCNANVVSIIEGKLPKNVGLEWYRLLHKQESRIMHDNKFSKLLEYLKIERNALEYSLADIRMEKGSTRESPSFTGGYNEEGECLMHPDAKNHNTEDCRLFLSKTNEERVAKIKEKAACWSCLNQGHRVSDCSKKQKCSATDCDKYHNKVLHEAYAAGITQHTINTPGSHKSQESCILLVMGIETDVHNTRLNVMWDTASTVSLITFGKAKMLQLKGHKTNLTITKTGGSTEAIDSYWYHVPLKERNGKIRWIVAYGLDKISTYINSFEVKDVLNAFDDVTARDISRPEGEIDVLVGLDYAAFHPCMVQNHNHLVLYENMFGKCLGGIHPNWREKTEKLISNACVNHMIASESFHSDELDDLEPDFHYEGQYQASHSEHTLKEMRELLLIRNGLTLKGDRWEAKYPWLRSPDELPDNYRIAFAMLCSTEKRLQKKPEIEKLYREQMNEMIDMQFARKIPYEELQNHEGAIHYIGHHEVIKPDSSSTPCRIVFNSSQNFHGHVLNEYWAKGPDLINNLAGVLLRYRENYVSLVGDIKKMYHTILISYIDQHTHRFLWRDMNTHKKPDIYAMNVVSFGDKPAGTITMVALRETARLNESEFPVACKTLLENIYVDDILDSVSSHDEARQLTSQIEGILKTGSFKVKGWIFSSTNEADVSDVDSEDKQIVPIRSSKGRDQYVESESHSTADETHKVLGMNWHSREDFFFYTVKLNFSKKCRNIRSEPDLKKCQLPDMIPKQLTKRMILSQINGLYDPLGLASAFTVKSKILWRNLWLSDFRDSGWDAPIPDHHHNDWNNFFLELFDMENIKFGRCLKPSNVTDDLPILIIFSDGSINAFGACAYIRWKLKDGSFESRLIAAKCRVAPIKRITIVRIEMNGAVIAARLKGFIERETRFKFERTYFFVDSEIVLAMLQKDSHGFGTYIGLRVAEIQKSTVLSDWYWVDGSLNIADWITKGRMPNELHTESKWQRGPDFISLDESMWPVKQKCTILEIPETIRTVMHTEVHSDDGLANRIRLESISKYLVLIRVTCRVLAMYKRTPVPSLENALEEPQAIDYQKAEEFWIRDCQSTFTEEDMSKRYVRLCPQKRDDGIWVVGGRASKWVEISYNKQCTVLLPYHHKFAKLYALFIHNISHSGVATTVSKIRLRFWIVNLHKMVRSIVYGCVPCKVIRKETIMQVMGKLPIERLKPAPAFHSTALDYFGPYEIKCDVNKRARRKCYGILFNCLSTRAVYIDIAGDYSTDSFKLVLRRFVTIHGYPAKLHSDNGSQLTAASKEMKRIIKGLDWETLRRFGAENGMSWSFTSADSPWQNGCSEALIRSCKRSISCAIGSQVLSFSELQTVMFESANILNERPVGRHPTDPSDDSYVCPNDLLLGRATSRVPSGPFRENTNHRQRFEFVQKIVDAYWKKMIRDFFPSLLIRSKWHVRRRNVLIGDIVIVQDSNAVRGEWKLARVTKIHKDEDGIVRNCELQYRQMLNSSTYSKKFTTIKRSVQRIIVLVAVDDEE